MKGPCQQSLGSFTIYFVIQACAFVGGNYIHTECRFHRLDRTRTTPNSSTALPFLYAPQSTLYTGMSFLSNLGAFLKIGLQSQFFFFFSFHYLDNHSKPRSSSRLIGECLQQKPWADHRGRGDNAWSDFPLSLKCLYFIPGTTPDLAQTPSCPFLVHKLSLAL